MEIKVRFEVVPAGNGVLAKAESLKLAALGSYSEEAVTALVVSVTAWCSGLQQLGVLQEVLDRKGLEWRGPGDGVIRVIPHVAQNM